MVYSFRIGTKIFANLYVEVPIADKIGQNGGISLVTGSNLWTLTQSVHDSRFATTWF